MKTRIGIFVLLSLLGLAATACSVSFTTAKIEKLSIGKNEKATPPATSFDAGEKIFAVADVTGLSGKHKLTFKVLTENVPGKGKGESAFEKSVDVEAAGSVWLALTLPLGGEYKVESTLLDDSGKEVDKKAATFSVKAAAPAPATKDDDADKDSEDK